MNDIGVLRKLSSDGRVCLPVQLNHELIATPSNLFGPTKTGYIVLYTRNAWESKLRKIGLPYNLDVLQSSQSARGVQRRVCGSIYPVTVDKLGRIIVPASLRKYAEINENIRFVLFGDYIEMHKA